MLTKLLHLLYEFITEDLRPLVREKRAYLNEKQLYLHEKRLRQKALRETVDPTPPFVVTQEGIRAGDWMNCVEAWDLLGISKSTLEERLNAGKLTRYHRKGDEHLTKPRVWLKRTEVEAYYRDYTLMKGREKK